MVVDKDGDLYAASNATTKSLAIMHHEGSLGLDWEKARAKGDRLVRVRITKWKPKKKKKT